MAYDRVVIVNPSTGTAETFRTRVSRDAVMEWLAERDALTAAGFPDRPPDVDLPTLRTWVQHPGEERHPYFADVVTDPAWPVWTARWHGGETLDISLGLFWSRDHYGMQVFATGSQARDLQWPPDVVRATSGVGAERSFPPSATEDEVWLAFEQAIAAFNEVTDWPERDPYLTDYTEYALMEMEVTLAKAEITRGFLSPLPEAHD